MMSETALRRLAQKEEFLDDFSSRCGIKRDCVFLRLQVTYDYTQHEEIDAVFLTSRKIYLFEVVTWTGRYRQENNKEWVREEKVEGVANHTPSSVDTKPNTTSSLVTVMTTKVHNPVAVARRKTKALKQYIESKIGPRNSSDFDYYVLVIREECVLSEDCLHPKVVPYSQLDSFTNTFRTGWGRWILEWYPMWPIWISGYTNLKNTLAAVPTCDVLHLKSGNKLYGELRSCPGVPYDKQTTSELQFNTSKTGFVFGGHVIKAKAMDRNKDSKLFEVQLETSSQLEFLCVEADSSTCIKLTDVDKVVLSRPWT